MFVFTVTFDSFNVSLLNKSNKYIVTEDWKNCLVWWVLFSAAVFRW